MPYSEKRGSPSKRVNRPKVSWSNHCASRALTTNQPSPFGLSPPGLLQLCFRNHSRSFSVVTRAA